MPHRAPGSPARGPRQFLSGRPIKYYRPTGNPAIPAYGSRLLQSDRVDVGYATIFPSTTIVKVIAAQVVVARFAGAAG